MKVRVNCKTRPIDYDRDYRAAIRSRMASDKVFEAETKQDDVGVLTLEKTDNGQIIRIDGKDIKAISFYLDNERPYAEIVADMDGRELSFVIATDEDNIDLGQSGVISFRTNLDVLAEKADIEVTEYIDPNPLNLCPEGVDNIEELRALRESEGVLLPDDSEAYDDDGDDYDYSTEDADTEDQDDYTDDGNADEDDEYVPSDEDIDALEQKAVNSIEDGTNELIALQNKIKQAKNRHIAEIERIVNGDPESEHANGDEHDEDSYDDDADYDTGVADDDTTAIEDSADEPSYDGDYNESEDSIQEETYGSIEDDAESDEDTDTSSLRRELSKLDDAREEVDKQLRDYDSILTRSRSETEMFISQIEDTDTDDTLVPGLISQLQEKQEHNEMLNTALKKEQVLNKSYIEQLDKTSKRMTAQSLKIDRFRRQLKFAQENQRKAEEFVKDARSGMQKVVQGTNQKIDSALAEVKSMRQQVAAAEKKASDERALREAAQAKIQGAVDSANEARERLETEKKRTADVINEYDKQLDEFTDEALKKIQEAQNKADSAETKSAERMKRITELENSLSLMKTKLMAAESKIGKRDIALNEAKKSTASRDAEYGKLYDQYDAQKRELENSAADLLRARAELSDIRKENDRLQRDLDKAVSDRDNAIAEKVSAVASIEDDKQRALSEASSDKANAVASVIGARDDALAASERLISRFNDAMNMPGGMLAGKKKLAAFESAFRDYLKDVEDARQRGDVGDVLKATSDDEPDHDEPVNQSWSDDDAPIDIQQLADELSNDEDEEPEVEEPGDATMPFPAATSEQASESDAKASAEEE